METLLSTEVAITPLRNASLFYAACIVRSCSWELYNAHFCVGFSITAILFSLLLAYTLVLVARLTVCKYRFVSWLRGHTSIVITVGCMLLAFTLVINTMLSPTSVFEFAAIAFHLITISVFVFSRQMDQIITQPRPNDSRPKMYLMTLIAIVIFIVCFTLAGAIENRDSNTRCMSLFHIGSVILELQIIPLVILQTMNGFQVVSDHVAIPIDRKNAILRSLTGITVVLVISASSSLVYTNVTLSLGHRLGSCSAVFKNSPGSFITVYSVYLVLRYFLPSVAILRVYVEPDIASREEQAVLLERDQQDLGPPSTSKFQYPARFRHLEIPTNEAMMAPPPDNPDILDSSMLFSGPGLTYCSLDNITEEGSELCSTSTNVRISAGTQMSCVSELPDDGPATTGGNKEDNVGG